MRRIASGSVWGGRRAAQLTVRTSADKRGANVVITVDEATGSVTGRFLPR